MGSSCRRLYNSQSPTLPSIPYASFLKDFVDPVHPSPSPGPGPASVHTFVSEWLESVGRIGPRETHCRSDSHPSSSCKQRSRFETARKISAGDGLHTGCRWVCSAADASFDHVPPFIPGEQRILLPPALPASFAPFVLSSEQPNLEWAFFIFEIRVIRFLLMSPVVLRNYTGRAGLAWSDIRGNGRGILPV